MQRDIKTKTRAFTYVLPSILEEVNVNKRLLVNCFLGMEGVTKDKYDGNIYLVFKFDEQEIDYEDYLIKHEQCILHKDIGEKYYLVGFPIPQKYIEDVYVNYIEGKFSKFPSEYKRKILKFHNLTSNSDQFKIIYKHPSLRKKISSTLGIEENLIGELGEKPEYSSDCLYNDFK